MDGRVGRLLDLSFHSCPGVDANAEIARVRAEYELEFGRAHGYEVVIPADAQAVDWQVLPRFAHHLRAKRLRPERCPQVFVAIFFRDMLYFLRSNDFIRHLLDEEHIDFPQIAARIEAWKRTHERPTVLALPHPDE